MIIELILTSLTSTVTVATYTSKEACVRAMAEIKVDQDSILSCRELAPLQDRAQAKTTQEKV